MPPITTFDSIRESLLDILRGIRDGKTQLPEFQRDWKWDNDHIRGLLASVSLSYPIGVVMMLQTGNPEVRLKARILEGVPADRRTVIPERLILDGQQRLTAMLQSLLAGQPVSTMDARNKPIRRWYYIDIGKALDSQADREEAIVDVSEDRIKRDSRGNVVADCSTPEKEWDAGLFPLAQVFDQAAWRRGHNARFRNDTARLDQFDRFEMAVIDAFKQYQVPMIILRKETAKEAVCNVFEKVNTGGVALNVFELLTATYAADDFALRDDWSGRHKRLKQLPVLSTIADTDFLQAISLLATRQRRQKSLENDGQAENAPGISCKRKDLLRLDISDYKAWADAVGEGFKDVARFLHSQKIFVARDLPYRTQLTPLAAILAVLGERADRDGTQKKLAQWYWCGVFGEQYGGAYESRFAKDVPEVLAWLDGGSLPATITEANFAANRLLGLKTRNSAAYKGLHALLMREGCLDFRTGASIDVQSFFDESIDIHHIFPQAWCRNNGIDAKRIDSIVNKTPLSARTNRIISGDAPGDYLRRMQMHGGADESRMDQILASHVIDSKALRLNDFDAFFAGRTQAMLDRIEAMGKTINRDAVEPDDGSADYEPEEPVESDV